MPVLAEFRNKAGDIVLDTNTKVLKVTSKVNIPTNTVIKYVSGSVTTGTWRTFWELEEVKSISGTKMYMSTNPYREGIDPGSLITWYQPLKGSAVAVSSKLTAFGTTNSGQKIIGEGINLAYTSRTVPNDVSGYLDCYDENTQELIWSLNSIINAPQIIKVFNSLNQTSLALTEFEEVKRNNLYFFTTYTGSLVYTDYGADVSTVVMHRVNDTMYFSDINGKAVNAQILVAYIP